MAELDLQLALRCAQEIAATAQLFVATDFRRADRGTKADGSDVTETDLRIERLAAERIHRVFPDHALLAEEAVHQPVDMPAPDRARYCWIVDPLDGTRNYARNLPCCTTAFALLDEGTPILAVTRDLFSGASYWALRGAGAFSGARRLQVATRPFDRHALVTFQPADDGSTYDRAPWFRQVHIRNFGTTALHLALVADGCVDGALCMQNRLWDVAGGALLVTEAGGVITRLDGAALTPFDLRDNPRGDRAFLAGSPGAHAAMFGGLSPEH